MDAPTPNPGRRILRHQARIARATGLSLARRVAGRRGVRRAAPMAAAARPAVVDPSPMILREPAADPGMTDFATQWMFGDTSAALSMPETQPWAGGAGFEAPPPEQRRLNRLAREGAPAAARQARIVEPGESLPAVARSAVPPSPAPAAEPDLPPAPRPAEPTVRAPEPTVAAAEPTDSVRSGPSGPEPKRVDVPPPSEPVRPALARVARPAAPRPVPAPAPRAAAADPAPAPRPGLFRRVAERLRGEPAPAPAPEPVAARPAPQPRPLPPAKPVRVARTAAAPAPAAPAPAPGPDTPAEPTIAREPAGGGDIGLSDFGMQWMFGDAPAALNRPDAQPWAGGAGYTPPPPEQRRLNRLAREGAPTAVRRAKIVEPGESLPPVVARTEAAETAAGRGMRDQQQSREPDLAPAPRRLARRPAAPPAPPAPEPRAAEPSEPTPSVPSPDAAAPARPSIARVPQAEAALEPPAAELSEPTPSVPSPDVAAPARPSIARVPQAEDALEPPAATPERPVLARVARPAAPQPVVPRLGPQGPVRRAISRMRPAPAPPAPTEPAPRATVARAPLQVRTASPTAARHSRTNAEALAAATGATLSRTQDGFAAVTFDAPAPPPARTTLSRADLETRPATTEPPAPATSTAQAESESAPSTDKDEIYEYVVDRLKRDLFAEQEQAGLGPTLL